MAAAAVAVSVRAKSFDRVAGLQSGQPVNRRSPGSRCRRCTARVSGPTEGPSWAPAAGVDVADPPIASDLLPPLLLSV